MKLSTKLDAVARVVEKYDKGPLDFTRALHSHAHRLRVEDDPVSLSFGNALLRELMQALGLSTKEGTDG